MLNHHTDRECCQHTNLHKRKMCFLLGVVFFLAILNIFVVLFVQFGERKCNLWITRQSVQGLNSETFVKQRLPFDVEKYTSQLISGVEPDIPPFNLYDYSYIIANKEKCVDSNGNADEITLLLVVKSAVANFKTRNAVRKTWGWEERFPQIRIMRIFNLGVHSNDTILQKKVMEEQDKHGDLIQGNFTDSYYNNTIKTLMSFRWVVEMCPTSKFIMFVDDDMYVSTKNALRFAYRPEGYPTYENSSYIEEKMEDEWQKVFNFDKNESPTLFFAGLIKSNEVPQRNKTGPWRKWYIPLSTYSLGVYPPYAPAGAYILSYPTLRKLYYVSMYTPHFKFDDVYLGMVAKKAGITLTHSDHFVYYVIRSTDYKNAIAIHNDEVSPEQIVSLWEKQHRLGWA